MAGVGEATGTAEPTAGLAASYAAVQSTLRRQFFGDLVELRGALVNTLNLEPQRADNLHLKLQLIDAALCMLEENKAEVTSADMASLMNMSAKVVRAVEAWRARQLGRLGNAAAESQQQQEQQQSASQQERQPPSTSQQQQSASHLQQQEQSAQGQTQLPQVLAVCVDGDGDLRNRIMSPFAAPEVQLAAQDPLHDTSTPALPASPPMAGAGNGVAATATGQGDDQTGTSMSSAGKFGFLSKLIVDPVDPLTSPAASLLPDIDWEVPELQPSGNLDTLLPSEASQVLLAQQRMVEQKRAAARAQRMSSAEAFLARVSANAAAEGSFATGGPVASGSLVGLTRAQDLLSHQQQRSQQIGLPPGLPLYPPSQPPAKQQKLHHLQHAGHHQVLRDQLAAAVAPARGSQGPLPSPTSAAPHSPGGAPHQDLSSNSAGGSRLSGAANCATAVGSAGNPATGSTEPSPSGSHHLLPLSQGRQVCLQAERLGNGYAMAALQPSPFSSAAAQGAVAGPPGQGACGASISAAPFGSTQLVHQDSGIAALQQQQQELWLNRASRSAPASLLPPPHATTSAGAASLGFGGNNPHSLQLSASSGRPGEMHSCNPSLVGELQLLGLSSGSLQLGSQTLPPHLQTMASYTQQTAAAAQLAAADHPQAERLSALRLLQQFPHAALHGGCGTLQQLLSAGDSFGAPGSLHADPAGQLQQVAALQAQQQAAQLAQVAALERYRRDQLHYQQLQQQLMQPFGGFPQLQPQVPAYQVQFASDSGTGPACSSGMPATSAGAAGVPSLPGHSASAGMPGLGVAANGQPMRISPSLRAGAGSNGAAGGWQAPNAVHVVGPHAGQARLMRAGSQHASRASYGAGFGESASLTSAGSSRQKRRRS